MISDKNDIKKVRRGLYLFEWLFLLIILSVLLSGIFLKGQGGPNVDSQVYDTKRNVRFIIHALNSFHAKHKSIPGDMKDVEVLSGCQKTECAGGNGDGQIGTVTEQNVRINEEEGRLFWEHLSKAGLLTDTQKERLGNVSYQSKYNHRYHVYSFSNKLPTSMGSHSFGPGLWLHISAGGYGVFSNFKTNTLTPFRAASFDRAFDDGVASTGTIRGAGNEECFNGTLPVIVYNEAVDKQCISLFVLLKIY